MSDALVGAVQGEQGLLLGNEAIVRGALEAGVNVVTCYPGTPSSEVPDTFKRISKKSFRLEYSVNEKVAMEVAAGSSLAGALTLVTMKHVGVNVAADPLFTLSYIGSPGGLVLMSADDPSCHSSQNEQDNRHYARSINMPCFEPSTAQEAKDMTCEALLLSRKLEQPIMLRTTTRLNHLRGAVKFGAIPEKPAAIIPFVKEPMRFVPVPVVARKRHVILLEQMKLAQEISESSKWNKLSCPSSNDVKIGIISSGVARSYLIDALYSGGLTDKVKVLHLGMTWPLPEKMLSEFLTSCTKVLIVEEGDGILERDIRALAQEKDIDIHISGKGKTLTVFGEYSTLLLSKAIAEFLGNDYTMPSPVSTDPNSLPMRPPNLCPGCSHRSVYYAVRKVYGDNAVYSSDIGCYTLGMAPPLSMADFLVCMGSSISAGSGFSSVSKKPVIAFIGDSTFFHSGLTGLANAVFNRHDLLIVILDNGTTAMTGHQPNPAMIQDVLGDTSVHLDIEAIVKAFGVSEFARVKAYNIKALVKSLEYMQSKSGVRVILADEPCVLYARRTLKKKIKQIAYVAEQGEQANQCLKELACPAFTLQDNAIAVDETLCSGCMVCLQVAPKAFKAKTLGQNS